MKLLLTLTVLILFAVIIIYATRIYSSVVVETKEGPELALPVALKTPDAASIDKISFDLAAAGLHQLPLLGDTGIATHLERLKNQEIDLGVLQQYADDLRFLRRFSTELKGPIPTTFWDVRTKEMVNKNWTEYSLVHQLTQAEWHPYLQLLAKSYARFLKFKAADTNSNDSALDAALDLISLTEDYYHAVPFADLIEHAEEIKGESEAVLMIWQSIVAGSTRKNPLTKKPLFSHSIFARNNVGTMHQYDIGKKMSIGSIWGVSGFADHFVGTEKNNNQIEHMSISIVLQLVMNEPVIILDAIEEAKLLIGHADAKETHADIALNNAIHKEFKPHFSENRLQAVELLRAALHK